MYTYFSTEYGNFDRNNNENTISNYFAISKICHFSQNTTVKMLTEIK